MSICILLREVHYLKFYTDYQSRNRNHHKQMDDRKSESILG